ncbi:hypothetical protein [Paenibacillus paeoniae]|uniref:Uncharacterized protein n=1 Tax=Paenibacillus paeoniae TaxID=2292705 RepID=A0A371PIV0_9BACL|nr:hypothetical protein [Paenibacillus paeoniae]REK76160.1 hypothetical protein DX130_03600 [Paenibacillus paeoniae]
MNRQDYQDAMESIVPDPGMEERLAGAVAIPQKRRYPRTFVYGTACLVAICFVVWAVAQYSLDRGETLGAMVPPVDAVVIPKMKLPKKSNAMADMIGLVVYEGSIYTQTSTRLTPADAKLLRGERLGRTKGGIDEWSKKTDYEELASSIGQVDIFAVNGYDESFRIMSYHEENGEIYAELYECLNGITIHSGEDLIGKLRLKNRVQSVNWQPYDAWYYSKPEFGELASNEFVDSFVAALYEAKPFDRDGLNTDGIYERDKHLQKMLFLTLEDGTEVRLWLFPDNYVMYVGAPVFFQVEEQAFRALWDQML